MKHDCAVKQCHEPGVHRLSLIMRKSGSDTGALWRRQEAWLCREHAMTAEFDVRIKV